MQSGAAIAAAATAGLLKVRLVVLLLLLLHYRQYDAIDVVLRISVLFHCCGCGSSCCRGGVRSGRSVGSKGRPSTRRVAPGRGLTSRLPRKHERASASTGGCGSVGRPGDDSGGRKRCRADQVQSSISEWTRSLLHGRGRFMRFPQRQAKLLMCASRTCKNIFTNLHLMRPSQAQSVTRL